MSSKEPLSASSLKPPAIRISPVDGSRPFWSVMIPTYNPRADYLEETLHSVLQQAPGPEQMQIEVVDDGSLDNTVSEVIWRVAAGLVTFYIDPQNHGLAK